MAKQILTSTSLKSAWEVIKEAPHVGDFLSWQITANLCELKLIKLKEDFTALRAGLLTFVFFIVFQYKSWRLIQMLVVNANLSG